MNKLVYENEALDRSVDFSSMLSILEEKIEDLAQFTISNYVSEGVEDGKILLETISDGLERWTKELVNRRITTRDFETLVSGERDLIEMDNLMFSGLALTRVEQFKGSVFNLIIDTVFNILRI